MLSDFAKHRKLVVPKIKRLALVEMPAFSPSKERVLTSRQLFHTRQWCRVQDPYTGAEALDDAIYITRAKRFCRDMNCNGRQIVSRKCHAWVGYNLKKTFFIFLGVVLRRRAFAL